ncbi:OapA family protein [Sinimarinibacterium thermocellulolyticum]|uniref:Peptidoglycan DD-metalloendopeptidase family protein n=1 Tax=Sinimarinibacterium thermocellulolyticum TaxID=3170016 RepID=A0ABV2A6Z8_9GAMM
MLLAAVATREGVAKRQSAIVDGALPSDIAATLSSTDAAFTESIQAALADTLPPPEPSDWVTVEVQRGQTLSQIFEAHGLGFSEAIAVTKLSPESARLKNLRAGDKLQLRKTPESRLAELRFELDGKATLHVRRDTENQLEAVTTAIEYERRQAQAMGIIENSLFLDGQRAGLSNRLLMQLAEIFGYDIDFALDLRVGDRFAVIYEELYRDDEKLRDGDIIAAEFVNRGRSFRAVRYIDQSGNTAYYTPEGDSIRKAFLRTPVDFARISSHFNLRRRHPILNTIRAHKGVDYAASAGTPIRATADGKVEFIGVKGGYGRVVILKHGSQYTTLYAHMSRFRSGLRAGLTVRQGQVIGYVGASGLATAPHLHYEFRVNGVHKDPVTVPLPRANPLPRSVLAQWKLESAPILARLDAMAEQHLARVQATATTATP